MSTAWNAAGEVWLKRFREWEAKAIEDFEAMLWGTYVDRRTPREKQRFADATRHYDPRAAGSTDPLGRYCTIHDKPYESDGGGPGAFSICPDCYNEEREEWKAKR